MCVVTALLAVGCSTEDDHDETVAPLSEAPGDEAVHIGPMFGVCIGLFYDDPDTDYEGLIWEAAQRGAAAVSLVVVATQESTESSVLQIPGDRELEELVRLSRFARSMGLHVSAMPVVLLKEHARGRWRGTIQPENHDRWWADYSDWLRTLGELGEQSGVDRLVVGSELNVLQRDTERWRALIVEVREVFRGELTYSANWDSLHSVAFWDALDVIGVSAYFSMPSNADGTPRVSELAGRWLGVQADLRDLSARWGRPLAITEVGYPSRSGAAARPWRHVGEHRADTVAQYRLFDGLFAAWEGQAWADAVFIWDYLRGGPGDSSYSPRGKPAGMLFRRPRGRRTPLIQPTEH